MKKLFLIFVIFVSLTLHFSSIMRRAPYLGLPERSLMNRMELISHFPIDCYSDIMSSGELESLSVQIESLKNDESREMCKDAMAAFKNYLNLPSSKNRDKLNAFFDVPSIISSPVSQIDTESLKWIFKPSVAFVVSIKVSKPIIKLKSGDNIALLEVSVRSNPKEKNENFTVVVEREYFRMKREEASFPSMNAEYMITLKDSKISLTCNQKEMMDLVDNIETVKSFVIEKVKNDLIFFKTTLTK